MFRRNLIIICVTLYLVVFAAFAQAQPPQIQSGLNYLTSSQSTDGTWITSAAQVETTAATVSVLEALKSLNQTAGSVYTNATTWLQNQSPIPIDYQAQRIHTLGLTDTSINALIPLLNQLQHAWGGDDGYVTDNLDTTSALLALKSANYPDQTLIFSAINYLLSTQNPDGGWSFIQSDSSNSTVYTTSQVLYSLAQYKNIYLMDQQLSNAVAFLLSKQNPDGGFGDGSSTVYETALAFIAHIGSGKTQGLPLQNAINYLTTTQSVNGSWNDDLYSTALALRALSYVKPDLSILPANITVLPATPTVGSSITVTASVANIGLDTATNVTVRLLDSGTTAGEQTIATIAPGGTGQATFAISPLTPVGEHILIIAVDPGNAITEISKTNNSATARIWAKALADLVVLPEYLSISPAYPKPTDSITLTYQIANMGETTATNVAADLYNGDPANGGVKLGSGTVSSITAGGLGNGAITFSLTTVGSHTLYLVADPLHAITETSATNNIALKVVTVNATGGTGFIDLSIPMGNLRITPQRPHAGDNVSVTTLAANLGTEAATADVELFDGNPIGGVQLYKTTITLNAGESRTISVPWQMPSGMHTLNAYIDRANAVVERDETNNSQTLSVMADMVDVEVSASDISITPEHPMDGDPATVTAVFQNRGINPTGAFNVNLYNGDPASGGTLLQTFAISNLAGDANQTISYLFSAARGTYRFYVVCDPENKVIEADKGNNLAIRSLLVKTSAEAKGPDLVPLEFDVTGVTTDPQTLRISGTAKVKFQNKGDDKVATPFRITAFEDKDNDGIYTEGTDLSLGSWDYSTPMNPNMVGVVSINLAGTVRFRDAPIYAMLDSAQVVFEQNKNNNSIRKGSACENRPANPIEPVVKWQWRSGKTSSPYISTSPPVVIGLTDDNGDGKIDANDIPSVLFVTQGYLNGNGILKALNGKTGQERFSVSDPAHPFLPGALIASGDINNNGKPEILLQGKYSGMMSYSNDGLLLWDNINSSYQWSINNRVSLDFGPTRVTKIADLDGTGQPMIVSGATVVNADGSIRSSSAHMGIGGSGDGVVSGASVVADLDMDGKQEIIVGNAAYNANGTSKWYNPAIADGMPVIARFGDDPYPEIVVASTGTEFKLYLLDHNGTIKWGPVNVASWEGWSPYGYGSVPTVADFDGDGELEIGIKGHWNYFIIGRNGQLKRTLPIPRVDIDNWYLAATVFDLNGDGRPEIILYSDQYLRIFDGKSGTILYEERAGLTDNNIYQVNSQIYQGVIVADVDGDGHAELVVTGQNWTAGLYQAEHWVRVYGAKNNDWQNTRRIWNQPGYHVTNVNDDGTIPRYETPSWLTNNSYHCNVPTSTGPNPYLASDLSASFVRVDMANYPASIAITVRIGNGGAKTVPAGIRTVFYDGDPANGGILIGSALTTKLLNPGDYEDVALAWNAPSEGNHTIVVNADADNTQSECDKTNNSVALPVNITSGKPDLNIVADDIIVPATIPEGSLANIFVTVRNIGTLKADNVLLRLYVGNPALGGKQIGSDQIVSTIAAGSAVTLKTIWNTLGVAGVSYLYALVDPAATTADVNRSNNTANRQILVTNAVKPDLQIGTEYIAITPAAPLEGDTLNISATIHNRGSQTGAVKVALYDGIPTSGGIKRAETIIPQIITQGGSTTATFALDTIGLNGSHALYVRIDPDNTIDESDKTNNQASRNTTIAAAGLTMSIATNKSAYSANENIQTTVSLAELNGTARSLVYDLLILDAKGIQAASILETALALTANANQNLTIFWNSSTTYAGSYTVMVHIKENNRIIAKSTAGISITPVKTANSKIVVDKIAYRTNEQVSMTANITGTSPNYLFSDLTAKTSITDSTGQVLFSATRTIPSLANGQLVEVKNYWNTGATPSGIYLVTFQLLDGTTVTTSANNTFTLTGSAATGEGLTGTVTTTPNAVEAGSNATIGYTITNQGNQDLASFTLNLLIVDPTTGQLLKTIGIGSELSLAMTSGKTGSVTLETTGIAPKTLLAILQYINQNTVKSLASGNLTVTDTTPPILTVSTLANGTYTNNQILNVAGTVTDNSGVKDLQINGVSVPVLPDNTFSQALPMKSGPNTISVVATDLGNLQSSDNRIISLDQTAPQLVIISPDDNSKTNLALLDVTGTVDDETSTIIATLNGVNQQVTKNGTGYAFSATLVPSLNTILVTATDLAKNSGSQKRTVIYDDQKPSLSITEPGQDIRTNQPGLTIMGTVADPYTQVGVSVAMDGNTFTPSLLNGQFQQSLSFTQEKSYAIVVTATNEAGSSTTAQRNVIYDATPPALTINPPTSPTTTDSQTVSGTRESSLEVMVTCATATVGAVTYPTLTTWQTTASNLKSGDNVITASSTDAAGNQSKATTSITLQTGSPATKINIAATPNVIWPPNHKMVKVKISGELTPNGAEIASVGISVNDEYGKYNYKNLKFGDTVQLEAWRDGGDIDGRVYTITVVVTDKAGNKTTKSTNVIVPHDQGN